MALEEGGGEEGERPNGGEGEHGVAEVAVWFGGEET